MPQRTRKPDERPKPGDRPPWDAPFAVGHLVKYNHRARWGEKVCHGSIGEVTAIKEGWTTPFELFDGYSVIDFPEGRVAVDKIAAKDKFEDLGKAQKKKTEEESRD
jgi:hypothetical protein